MPFVLIIIAILLIVINYRALKKEDKSFDKILGEREEGVNDHDIEIAKLRREFSETILELQLEIERLKAIKNSSEDNDNRIDILDLDIDTDDEDYTEAKVEHNEETETKNPSKNVISDKARAVKELLDRGFTDDQICEELAIGKGEVLLIKGLYRK
jgi:hypothetical protein